MFSFKKFFKVKELIQKPKAGEEWIFKDESPWPSKYLPVKILDCQDGWVRYDMGEYFKDQRIELNIFLRLYEKLKLGYKMTEINNLSEKSLEKAIKDIKIFQKCSSKTLNLIPTKILIPAQIKEYLNSMGYNTQEKIMQLYDELLKDLKK